MQRIFPCIPGNIVQQLLPKQSMSRSAKQWCSNRRLPVCRTPVHSSGLFISSCDQILFRATEFRQISVNFIFSKKVTGLQAGVLSSFRPEGRGFKPARYLDKTFFLSVRRSDSALYT
jgi:hypothetical protein